MTDPNSSDIEITVTYILRFSTSEFSVVTYPLLSSISMADNKYFHSRSTLKASHVSIVNYVLDLNPTYINQ